MSKIEEIHRRAYKASKDAACNSFDIAAKDPQEAIAKAEEVGAQILADIFPQQPLSDEQEKELQEIIDEHTEKQNISPETKTFKQRDFLLKLIAQFKNQPSQDQQLIEVLCSDLQDAQEKIEQRCDGVDVEAFAETLSTDICNHVYSQDKENTAYANGKSVIKIKILSTFESMKTDTPKT